MGSYVEKEEVKKALAKAKELEKKPEPIPTKQREVEIYKDMIALSEKMKSMLKSSWFVKDVHSKNKPAVNAGVRKKAKKVVVRKSAAKKKR